MVASGLRGTALGRSHRRLLDARSPLLDRRLCRLFTSRAARRRFGPRLAPRIDRALWQLVGVQHALDLSLGRALRRLRERSRYSALGFVLWTDYARERVGIPQRTCQEVMRLARGCDDVPELGAALEHGELSKSKVLALLGILTAGSSIDDRARWIQRAREMTVRELVRAVRAERSERGSAAGDEGRTMPTEDGSDACGEGMRGGMLTIRCPARTVTLARMGFELVERLHGQRLPRFRSLEFMIADWFSAMGWPGEMEEEDESAGMEEVQPRERHRLPATVERTEDALPGRRERVEAACREAAAGWAYLSWQREPQLLDPALDASRSEDAFALDAAVMQMSMLARRVRVLLGQLLTAMSALDGWRPFGFASFDHYCRERIGVEPRSAARLMRFARALDAHPALGEAHLSGVLSYLQVLILIPVVRRGTAEAWVEWAARKTCLATAKAVDTALMSELNGAGPEEMAGWADLLRHAGGSEESAGIVSTAMTMSAPRPAAKDPRPVAASPPPPATAPPLGAALPPSADFSDPVIIGLRPGTPLLRADCTTRCFRIRVFCPEDLLVFVRAGFQSCRDASGRPLPAWRALELFVMNLLDHLDDPERERLVDAFPVLERDGWQCQVPGCSGRGVLHSHHIQYRSHGGSDDEHNRTTLCAPHHRRHIHERRSVSVAGLAPAGLEWQIGRRCGTEPLLRFRGETLITEPAAVAGEPELVREARRRPHPSSLARLWTSGASRYHLLREDCRRPTAGAEVWSGTQAAAFSSLDIT